MAADVERVLVALGLVLVLETIAAVVAFVLLLGLVSTVWRVSLTRCLCCATVTSKTYASSSAESNFLGFLGQHSHM